MATDQITFKFCLSHFNVPQFSHHLMQTNSEDVQIVNNKSWESLA